MDKTIASKLKDLLTDIEFVSVATSDAQGRPNAAPKFLLKVEGNLLYIVDCVMGQTWDNLKSNPRVSIPIMDVSTLVGYRINGTARLIEAGPLKQRLEEALSNKQIKLSTLRVVEGIKKEKRHEGLELEFPETVGIFVVKVDDVLKISPTGTLTRQGRGKRKR